MALNPFVPSIVNMMLFVKLQKLFENFKHEAPSMLRLAIPVAMSQLGQMFMAIVDTYMVGKLGPQQIGAVGIANAYFFAVAISGIGVLLGLDYLVSHAHGRGVQKECNYWLVQGVSLALIMSIPTFLLLYFAADTFHFFGITAEVADLAKPFLQTLIFSLPAFFIFVAFRQYLQALNHVGFVTILLISANALNYFLNWVFIFGNLGVKPMGVLGSAVATNFSRIVLVLLIVAYTFVCDEQQGWGLKNARWWPEAKGLRSLLKLGTPASIQMLFEVGVFSATTTLAGKLGALPLAAHQIVLNVASLTFMVPFGISSAAAVRVGQEIGAGRPARARNAGWTAIFMGASFMACSAFVLWAFGHGILALFTKDENVIALGMQLLFLAAVFQIADGIQVVGTGSLRGVSDTKRSMFANLIGYWFLGLPLGMALCFGRGRGIQGLWYGLTLGLIVVATLILVSWSHVTNQLKERNAAS